MRLVFMGTPDFSVPVLDALVEAGHEIACVYCQPPRPAGRGKKDRPSPVQAAEALGLPVRHPVSLKSPEAQADFAALGADVAVVVAYGLILPQAVLDAPRTGCLNIHASLLPRWRGAAPIQRAIMAGDAETGVCIMQMEAGLDTGPVLCAQGAADRGGGNGGRVARPAVRAGRDGHRGGAGPTRHAHARAAAGGGRHLCRQDRQGRGAPSTGPATPRRSTGHPGPVAVSGGVDHGRGKRVKLLAVRRGRFGRARDRPGRGEDRLRRRRGGVDRGATGRKIAYVCGGVAARCPPVAPGPGWETRHDPVLVLRFSHAGRDRGLPVRALGLVA
jgi:hypothetical protein